ncbi:MAG TPA: type II toxin-antitoxin system prevent-host-death family antitoxin [Planctomycetota bacterium]|jgi:prevent-host-death family protein|nr:type II toxin-antitoxin system prevent-host-death family antitoxin [Planctomycetota bacterium]
MKSVGVAELKSRLSQYLRRVRRGETIVVLDRQTPIARLVPYESGGEGLRVRPPIGKYGSIHRVPLPPPLRLKKDIVEYLLEERQGDR